MQRSDDFPGVEPAGLGARLDRTGTELLDFQTALLFEDEKNWTTRGNPEGREKSPSYSWGKSGRKELNHIRKRFYRADAFVTVALRLGPADQTPDIDAIATALITPARPLFIGRKPCLPARPVYTGETVDAATVLEALLATTIVAGRQKPSWRKGDPSDPVRMVVPPHERQPTGNDRTETISNVRDWVAGVHAGENRLVLLSRPRTDFPPWPPGALP